MWVNATKISMVNANLNLRLTTLLKRKALPVAPVNLVEINSPRLVKKVPHWRQEKIRAPPKFSK